MIKLKKHLLIVTTFSGLTILLLLSIPITSSEVVINTSLTDRPSNQIGPYDNRTVYHTRVLGRSVLRGEITVEGEGIYLRVNGYNTQYLKNISVKERYSFVIDPADDQYTFTFDNTEGLNESFINFKLEEIFTRPIILYSHLSIISGLITFA